MIKKRPPLYSQSDKRWGRLPYTVTKSPNTLTNAGCGPTSMAMVVSALTEKTILPSDLRLIAIDHKDIAATGGSEWDFFQHVVEHYKPLKCKQTASFDEAFKALKDINTYVVASMKPGHFTKGGHFIVLCAVDVNGNILVNDPNGLIGKTRSKWWDDMIIKAEAKQYWIISK